MPGAVCQNCQSYYDIPGWPKVKVKDSRCPKCGEPGKFCRSIEYYDPELKKLAKWKEWAGK